MRNPVEEAAQALTAAREKLAQVEAERGAAQAELEELNRRAGEEVLDAPESAGKLSRAMQELRERIELLGRAVDAQEPRVEAARSVYLLAEAAVLEKQVEKARGVLERHEARTAELLALLEEHEGKYVPEVQLLEEMRSNPTVVNPPMSWKNPRSQVLRAAVEKAERPVRILRQLAAGEDPAAGADDYPPCVWGAEALVKAPAYLRTVGRHHDEVERLDRRLDELPVMLEDLRGQEAELVASPRRETVPKVHPEDDPLVKVRRRIAAVEAEIGRMKAERAGLSRG